jgi:hypothetical protein
MRENRITEKAGCKIETREDGKKVLVGYGAVFHNANDPGTEYMLWEGLSERIATTAFNRAISESQDVRGLFNHDANIILGRTTANTMRISVDMKGLRYEIDLPDTAQGRDLALSVERGDIDGSSFGFVVRKQSYAYNDDGPNVRTIEDVDLYDVGPVVFPAYTSTSAGLRSAIYRAGPSDNAEEAALRAEYDKARQAHKNTILARQKIIQDRINRLTK